MAVRASVLSKLEPEGIWSHFAALTKVAWLSSALGIAIRGRRPLMADVEQAGRVEPTRAEQKKMAVVGAAFFGVGAMVGAGIFALLGQAGAFAGARAAASAGR